MIIQPSLRPPGPAGDRVLVIGAGGFIGVNVAEALARRGYRLVLADRIDPPQAIRAALGDAPWHLGDVRDERFMQSIISQDLRAIVWGAALTADAQRDAAQPDAILDVNLVGLARALRLARAAGVGHVVNLGSVASFGEAAFIERPLREDDPTDPRSLYALSKFSGERLCARFAELTGQTVTTLRLSAAFGPWERRTGARDTTSPFMRLMELAGQGEVARLERPGLRDWVYAPDVAEAVAKVIGARDKAPHRIFHVGSGQRFSVLAWGEALAARWPGWQCRLTAQGEAPNVELHGARDRADLSVERLAGELSVRPRFGLAESVEHLDEWARAHPGWFTAAVGS